MLAIPIESCRQNLALVVDVECVIQNNPRTGNEQGLKIGHRIVLPNKRTGRATPAEVQVDRGNSEERLADGLGEIVDLAVPPLGARRQSQVGQCVVFPNERMTEL